MNIAKQTKIWGKCHTALSTGGMALAFSTIVTGCAPLPAPDYVICNDEVTPDCGDNVTVVVEDETKE